MHLWVKQPAKAGDVTGTAVMMLDNEGSSPSSEAEEKPTLKSTKEGVILSPQPHDNPNDPLNWPIWRRDIALGVIGFYSFIIGGQTPLLAPVMTQLSHTFDKEFHQMTYLVGTLMLSMGVGSMFFAPAAVVFGKRLIYLISQCVFFAGCIWGANANSFGSLMGARVLTGIGGGPAESLPSTTIAEIYFAHERAYRLGIYTLLLLGGKNIIPLVSGFIAKGAGWHWVYWVLTIIAGVCWIGTFLFIHETFWDRAPVPNKRSIQETAMAREARKKLNRPSWEHLRPGHSHSQSHDGVDVHLAERQTLNETTPKVVDDQKSLASLGDDETVVERRPFMSNLAVYTGRKSSDPLWMTFFRPYVLWLYPGVLFSTLLYGTSVVWLSVIAETISSIFTNAPYHFPSTSIGLLYIGTFIGGCLGSAVAGKLSDWIVRVMSKRNGGVYEPEFRLVMVAPVGIAVAIGLMGFGWSTFDKDHWIVPAVFLGVLGFGTSLGSTVAITYTVDCYRMYAAEALVSLNFAKNAMGFGFSIFVPLFLEKSGLKTTYVVYGCVEIGLCLLAIPLYHYGKCLRSFMDDHDVVRKLYK